MRLDIALVFMSAYASVACGGSFEEARNPAVELGAPPQSSRCESLDDRQAVWGGASIFTGALAGGSGLSAIPVPDNMDEVRLGLLIGSGVMGATSLATGFYSRAMATSWARECTGK